MKLVSVALCTFNGAAHLEQQLISIVNQSYTRLEVIVQDDGSTDDTLKILAQYQRKYPYIQFEQNSETLGYVKNFEKAISRCQGEYIALCDQDDIWEFNKIELQVKLIGDAALIYHDSAFMDEEGQLLSGKLSDIYPSYSGTAPYRFLFLNCVAGHSILFHRRIISSLIPFPPNYFHDRWIALIATERGGIKALSDKLVYYRQHTKSQTDIFNLKTSELIPKKDFFDLDKIQWIRHSAEKSIKHSSYFYGILSCFNKEGTIIRKFKLWILLSRHASLIFASNNKSGISRLNYIRKICFNQSK